MHAGSAAQVLLAWEEPERMHRGLRGAKFTATTLAGVRRRGWAQSVGEREPGVASVSAPVRGPAAGCVAAVSVSGPIERLTRHPGGCTPRPSSRPGTRSARCCAPRPERAEGARATGLPREPKGAARLDFPREPKGAAQTGLPPRAEAHRRSAAAWTEERRRSDEGRQRLKGAPEASGNGRVTSNSRRLTPDGTLGRPGYGPRPLPVAIMDIVRFRQNPQNRRNGCEVAPMKVAVVKETAPGERRVALVPEAVAKLHPAGIEVLVESGAGDGAWLSDAAYAEAGAIDRQRRRDLPDGRRDPDRHQAWPRRMSELRPGQAVIGMLRPADRPRARPRRWPPGA